MMKSIVAGMDGSEGSFVALGQAAAWAKRLKADLRGVYVEDERRLVTFPTYSESEGTVPKPVPLPEAELKKVEQELEAEEREMRRRFEQISRGGKLHPEFRLFRGRVNAILTREAQGADLVVIGKRGRKSNPYSTEAGPTTQAVLHEAVRPVLVVPKDAPADGPVLVAYDGSLGAQRAMVPGLELASALGASVTVLTVNDDMEEAEEIQEPLRDYLAPYKLKTDFRVDTGNNKAGEIILATANEIEAGLIVMGAFTSGPLKEFFFGSVTRTVLGSAPCSILMMT